MKSTPLAFIIFNRPGTTERVFEVIRHARPVKLLVIADGPRQDRPGEEEKCAAARAIIHRVDWPCEVLKNYSEINLGCRKRVASGLDWVFSNVEEAIILEDDCLPDPCFFPFCEELLERYRNDTRISMIGGSNFQFGHRRTNYSYYFSRYNHIWGWASWRRSWRNYNVEMNLWPLMRDTRFLYEILGNSRAVNFWRENYDRTYQGLIDSWDLQWTFNCWIHRQLCILPATNLVKNIGFNDEATHTKCGDSELSNIPTEEMYFPLVHPDEVRRDRAADQFTQDNIYGTSLNKIIINNLRKLIMSF